MRGILLNTFGVHTCTGSCRPSLFCLEFLLMLKDPRGEKKGYCLTVVTGREVTVKIIGYVYGWLRTDSVGT